MRIYVDELPKSCEKCKFYECETELVGEWGMENHRHICKINGSLIQGICPLHPLSDYTKQVRKEVISKVYKVLEQAIPHDLCWSWAVIKKELDQIQGQSNNSQEGV